jgi:hypothetical protein
MIRQHLFFFALLLSACSSTTETGTNAPAPAATQAPRDTPPDAPPTTPPACTTNVVPFELEYGPDVVDTQLVPVKTATEEGWLALDTGSSLTFVYGKDDAKRSYEVTIGCETMKVIRRDFDRDEHKGKPILGVLGADFLRTTLSELDYPGKKIVRHLDAASKPQGVDGYTEASILDANGHIAVRAEVDGTSRVLMVDTGSPHVLLVPVEGRPTDKKTAVQDVTGESIPAFIGDSDVKLGTETKRVPAYRIPKWDYFESYQKELHPELAGLFGLSALGFRRVVIDQKAGSMRLGPIQPLP